MPQSYQIEFPDFPVSTMPDVPNDYADVSWRNDMSPCFARVHGSNEVRIWIDYPEANDREFPEMKRFSVTLTRDCENTNEPVKTLETDDWSVAVETALLYENI